MFIKQPYCSEVVYSSLLLNGQPRLWSEANLVDMFQCHMLSGMTTYVLVYLLVSACLCLYCVPNWNNVTWRVSRSTLHEVYASRQQAHKHTDTHTYRMSKCPKCKRASHSQRLALVFFMVLILQGDWNYISLSLSLSLHRGQARKLQGVLFPSQSWKSVERNLLWYSMTTLQCENK